MRNKWIDSVTDNTVFPIFALVRMILLADLFRLINPIVLEFSGDFIAVQEVIL